MADDFALARVGDTIEYILGDVDVDRFQILLGALGEQDFEPGRRVCHQLVARLARRRATTSATGLVLPTATS